MQQELIMSNAEEIKKLEEKIAELKAADTAMAAMTPEQRFAISMHGILCHHNHTDGCGWFYEGSNGTDDWGGQAHSRWLMSAKKVSAFCKNNSITLDQAANIVKLTREL